MACPSCGDDCWYDGYPWCRPCGEHHRPPECAVDEEGRSLMPCGCAWSVVEAAGFDVAAHYSTGCYLVIEREEERAAGGLAKRTECATGRTRQVITGLAETGTEHDNHPAGAVDSKEYEPCLGMPASSTSRPATARSASTV